MKPVTMAVLTLGVWMMTSLVGEERSPIPETWTGKVTDAASLPVEQSAWGTLQWICNEKLMPGAAQTVGLATTLPGKQNPLHYHPNCEEVLFVLSVKGCTATTTAPSS